MNKKIIIAAGGTGGHIFPAQATAKKLYADHPDIEILFMAGKLASNAYFTNTQFSIQSISCGSIAVKNPIKLLQNLMGMGRGLMESRRHIQKFKPDLVIGFGSYHTLPVLLAAKWEGIPIILHESNSIPGKVNRLLAPLAKATCVQFPITAKLLKGKTHIAEMPLREGYRKGSINRGVAHDYYRLDPQRKTLLVFGGSQGAQGINRLMMGAAHDFQVIHLSGSAATVGELQAQYQARGIVAIVKSFEERMDYAWQAADLVLCRSGAGTIAEQIEFEVPAIFIPYPHAADDHQQINAEFVVKTVGGGVVFAEKSLTAEKLSDCLRQIPLDAMKKAIADYKTTNQENRERIEFCSLIKTILSESKV